MAQRLVLTLGKTKTLNRGHETSSETVVPCYARSIRFYLENQLNTHIYDVVHEIPQGLAKLANGCDIIGTHEVGLATNTAPQTIRKHLCLKGHFHGCKPIKIGGRLHFSVSDIAKLIRGEK